MDGPEDLKNALAIQDQLRLTPLSQFGKSDKQVPPDLAFSNQRVVVANPQNVKGDLLFFVELANALEYTPPKPQDAVVAESLSQIGFKDKNAFFDYNSLTERNARGSPRPCSSACTSWTSMHSQRVRRSTAGAGVRSPESWVTTTSSGPRSPSGTPAEMHRTRRSTLTVATTQGSAFHRQQALRDPLREGEAAPAQAFWSISMYNSSDGSFVSNPIKRYTVGDRTPGLMTNPDGSLEIFIQNAAPQDPKEKANWLPAPSGSFYLNLRMYGPDDSLQKGAWKPPVVKVRN